MLKSWHCDDNDDDDNDDDDDHGHHDYNDDDNDNYEVMIRGRNNFEIGTVSPDHCRFIMQKLCCHMFI